MVRWAPALELEASFATMPNAWDSFSASRQLQVSPMELLYSMASAPPNSEAGRGHVMPRFRAEVVVGGGIATADVVRRLELEFAETMTQKLQAGWEWAPSVSLFLGWSDQRLPWMLTAFPWCWKS